MKLSTVCLANVIGLVFLAVAGCDDAKDRDGEWCDTRTKLCWEVPVKETGMLLEAANKYCDNLVLAGHEDWRLPKIQELISLIRGCVSSQCGVRDPECLKNSCADWPPDHGCELARQMENKYGELVTEGCHCDHCDAFEGPGKGGCYWDNELGGNCGRYLSSSLRVPSAGFVWIVDMRYGLVEYDTDSFWVRCVRNAVDVDAGEDGGS